MSVRVPDLVFPNLRLEHDEAGNVWLGVGLTTIKIQRADLGDVRLFLRAADHENILSRDHPILMDKLRKDEAELARVRGAVGDFIAERGCDCESFSHDGNHDGHIDHDGLWCEDPNLPPHEPCDWHLLSRIVFPESFKR